MKIQTTITVEEDILLQMIDKLRNGSFRNKSHLFEFAVRKFLEAEK